MKIIYQNDSLASTPHLFALVLCIRSLCDRDSINVRAVDDSVPFFVCWHSLIFEIIGPIIFIELLKLLFHHINRA